jgi:hypothetical protein
MVVSKFDFVNNSNIFDLYIIYDYYIKHAESIQIEYSTCLIPWLVQWELFLPSLEMFY